jgi:hypothetical protein
LRVVVDEAARDLDAIAPVERGAADQFVPEIVDLAVMQTELCAGVFRQQQEKASELLFDLCRFRFIAARPFAITPLGQRKVELEADTAGSFPLAFQSMLDAEPEDRDADDGDRQ